MARDRRLARVIEEDETGNGRREGRKGDKEEFVQMDRLGVVFGCVCERGVNG